MNQHPLDREGDGKSSDPSEQIRENDLYRGLRRTSAADALILLAHPPPVPPRGGGPPQPRRFSRRGFLLAKVRLDRASPSRAAPSPYDVDPSIAQTWSTQSDEKQGSMGAPPHYHQNHGFPFSDAPSHYRTMSEDRHSQYTSSGRYESWGQPMSSMGSNGPPMPPPPLPGYGGPYMHQRSGSWGPTGSWSPPQMGRDHNLSYLIQQRQAGSGYWGEGPPPVPPRGGGPPQPFQPPRPSSGQSASRASPSRAAPSPYDVDPSIAQTWSTQSDEKQGSMGAPPHYHQNHGFSFSYAPSHYDALIALAKSAPPLRAEKKQATTTAEEEEEEEEEEDVVQFSENSELANAVQTNNTEEASRLLQNGANANERSANGTSLLIVAAAFGNYGMIEVLHKFGADVNATNKKGVSALVNASRNGWTDCVKLLVNYGADPLLETADGDSAESLASRYGHKEIVVHIQAETALLAARTLRSFTRFSLSKDMRIYLEVKDIDLNDVLIRRKKTRRGKQKQVPNKDVPGGRKEKADAVHPGNLRYRRIIRRERPVYDSNLTNYIVDEEIKGRFVKLASDGRYFLLTKEEARAKVNQSLRAKYYKMYEATKSE